MSPQTEEKTLIVEGVKVTPEWLAELDAQASAATPGPWTARWDGIEDPTGEWVLQGFDRCDEVYPNHSANLTFAAVAREAVPVLVAEVRRLWNLLATARGNHLAAGNPWSVHPVHAWYGPCDAFAPGGMCSVCLEEIERLDAAGAEIRRQLDALTAGSQPPSDQGSSSVSPSTPEDL